jgi:hypothetical protein
MGILRIVCNVLFGLYAVFGNDRTRLIEPKAQILAFLNNQNE